MAKKIDISNEEMIDLGDRVRDKITSFIGIATAVTLYLHKCPLIEVTAKELLDGELITLWFDESRLEIVTKQEYKYDFDDEEVVKN